MNDLKQVATEALKALRDIMIVHDAIRKVIGDINPGSVGDRAKASIAALTAALETTTNNDEHQAARKRIDGPSLSELVDRLRDVPDVVGHVAPRTPVGYLWQHRKTRQVRFVQPNDVITVDDSWEVVGPLVLDK